jgi:hypothetical protein
VPEQPIDALSGNDFGRGAPNATAEMIELLSMSPKEALINAAMRSFVA